MIGAVYDSSILVSGLGWHGDSYLCLVAMARRRVKVYSSVWILEEVSRRLKELEVRQQVGPDVWPAFTWFSEQARIVVPAPTGKRRSRDPKDDPVIGTALASGAGTIVTRDRDLLVLERPFGVKMVHPRDFLRELKA